MPAGKSAVLMVATEVPALTCRVLTRLPLLLITCNVDAVNRLGSCA